MSYSNRWENGAALALVAAAACGWSPAAAQDASSAGNDAIIVIGEKTERSLQDTVSSVAVTTAARIEDENIQTLNDIINRTANVAETLSSSGFTIRGIDNRDVTGGSGAGGMVTVYVDGAPLPDNGVLTGPLNMWDIGQVEILRGPQSTLQGRNSLAGSVIIRSQDPTYDWSLRGRAIGSDAGESYAIAGGGAIIEDQLAFRIAVEDSHERGFIYNATRAENEDEADNLNARLKILFEPAALDRLRVLATYAHSEHEGGYNFTYTQTTVPDYFDNRTARDNDLNSVENTSDFFTLEGAYELSDRFTLTSVTSWSDVDDTDTYDGDWSELPLSSGGSQIISETLTQEFRLNYEGEQFDGLIGVYYSDRENASTSYALTNVALPTTTISALLSAGLFGPTYQADPDGYAAFYESLMPVVPVDYSADTPSQVQTVALFADGTVQLTPRLAVIGGFRYDREEYTLAVDQVTTFAGTLPDPLAFAAPYDTLVAGINSLVGIYVGQANASSPADTRAFEAFLPKIGVTYDWADDIATSFVVQRGYRSGGSAINIAQATIVPYDPEYTINYEFSFRSQWLDDTLTVNANAFYIDWTDQQVLVYFDPDNFYDYQTENAGSSSLYGFEVEISHRPTDTFEWYAALGHTRTEFDDFTVSSGLAQYDLSGTEFSNAPHWTLSAGATQRWSNGFIANINASWRDDSFSTVGADQDIYAIDARTLVNTRIGYQTDHWGAYVFANNLLDEHYIQYPYEAQGLAVLGDPRVIGVTLEAEF